MRDIGHILVQSKDLTMLELSATSAIEALQRKLSARQGCQVGKNKKPRFVHKQFKISSEIKKARKGQNFLQRNCNKNRFKYRISLNLASFAQIFSKTGLKIYYFVQHLKRPKVTKSFYLCKQLQKGQMATLIQDKKDQREKVDIKVAMTML